MTYQMTRNDCQWVRTMARRADAKNIVVELRASAERCTERADAWHKAYTADKIVTRTWTNDAARFLARAEALETALSQ